MKSKIITKQGAGEILMERSSRARRIFFYLSSWLSAADDVFYFRRFERP